MHKIDKSRLQPDGRAIVVLEDDRKAIAMARVPGLSTVIAVARVLNARRLLELKFGGHGEVRYAANARDRSATTAGMDLASDLVRRDHGHRSSPQRAHRRRDRQAAP